jgi:hypothetical protein
VIKLKMLEDRLGSHDGIDVRTYANGQVYDLPERLANDFLANGWAEAVKAEPAKPAKAAKAAKGKADDPKAPEQPEPATPESDDKGQE